MADNEAVRGALPEYEVLSELGRGAMGVVYLGRHRKLGRSVAIKELPRNFAADPGVRERFVHEAQVLASLDHPHVVPVYDFVERDDQLLLVMQALPGGTLWDRFVDEGLAMAQACAVAMATCAGLGHAHDKAVLHRDIKPENLMFDDDGSLKVTDFGIAKVMNGATAMATVEGSVLGTPAYMAPEQASGDPVTAQADVYATGTMLFELLSGRLPFTGGENAMSLLVARISQDPPALASVAPHVPASIAAVVDRAIAKKPSDRYRSAEEFGIALGEAAARAWGPDWLGASGHPVEGAPLLTEAARTTGAGPKPSPKATAGHETIAPASSERDSNATLLPGQQSTAGGDAKATVGPDGITADDILADVPADPSPAQPEPAADPPAVAPPVELVRPKVKTHQPGADLRQVDPGQMVAVSSLLERPKQPVLSGIVALLGLLGGALLAWTGLGAVPDEVNQLAGATINGQSIDDDPVDLIVSDELFVAGLPDGDEARVTFSFAGQDHVQTDSRAIAGGQSVIPVGASEFVVTGATTARLEALRGGEVIAAESFVVNADNPPHLTAFGLGGALVGLLSLASLESNLRPLRRGRRKIGSFIGLAIFGALLGLTMVIAAGIFGGTTATITTLIAAPALAALGSVGLGAFLLGRAKRKRIDRRNEYRS